MFRQEGKPAGQFRAELFLCLDIEKLTRNPFHSSSARLSVLKGSQRLAFLQRMYVGARNKNGCIQLSSGLMKPVHLNLIRGLWMLQGGVMTH